MERNPRRSIVRPFASLATVVCLGGPLVGAAEAAFPGANGKIAFESRRDGNPEIYVMNADGSGQTRLTNNTAFDSLPEWSPDGTRIAFHRLGVGADIYVMTALEGMLVR